MGAQTIVDYTALNIHIESIDSSYQVVPEITACLCDELISPLANDSLKHSTKMFPMESQNIL